MESASEQMNEAFTAIYVEAGKLLLHSDLPPAIEQGLQSILFLTRDRFDERIPGDDKRPASAGQVTPARRQAGPIPCPFEYANKNPCPGHVIRVLARKTNVHWHLKGDGSCFFGWEEPELDYRIFCSAKPVHSIPPRNIVSPQVRMNFDSLPQALRYAMLTAQTASGLRHTG